MGAGLGAGRRSHRLRARRVPIADLLSATPGLPCGRTGSLRRNQFARAVQGSNSIEGYEADLDDTVAIDMGQEALDASEETTLAIRGYRDAMTYVLQLAEGRSLSGFLQHPGMPRPVHWPHLPEETQPKRVSGRCCARPRRNHGQTTDKPEEIVESLEVVRVSELVFRGADDGNRTRVFSLGNRPADSVGLYGWTNNSMGGRISG